MILGKRTSNALKELLEYDSLLVLAHELDSLDRTTRLSPESCQTIANSRAVEVLLQILNESNRSEAYKEIVCLTIRILLNLTKVRSFIQLFFDYYFYFLKFKHFIAVREDFTESGFKRTNDRYFV